MDSTTAIREFLEGRFQSSLAGRAIERDTSLFASGIVDSFGVLELIAFLEDTFGVTIDTTRHDLPEFDSIAKIESLLDRTRGVR
jgi:acyl carrier protein